VGVFEVSASSAIPAVVEVSHVGDLDRLVSPSRVIVNGDFAWPEAACGTLIRELDLRGLAEGSSFFDGHLNDGCDLIDWIFLEVVELPRKLRNLPHVFFCGCRRLRRVNLSSLTSLESIVGEVFTGCVALGELRFPPQWAEIAYGPDNLEGCGLLSLDLSEILPGREVRESFDVDGASCLETLIIHRRVTPVGLGLGSLRSLTLGRARGACGRPSEVRFTSMLGRSDAAFVPSVAKSVVFGEVAAVGGRVSRPALLP
jgi:hypothetical protein